MISIDQIRKTIPEANSFTDEELIKLRDNLYPAIERILDKYLLDSDKIEL